MATIFLIKVPKFILSRVCVITLTVEEKWSYVHIRMRTNAKFNHF